MNETTGTIDVAVNRRDFLNAMEDLPRIMTDRESVTIKHRQYFLAVLNDFLNTIVTTPLDVKVVDEIVNKQFEPEPMRVMLLGMGFIASRNMLPAIRKKIDVLQQKIDVASYIVKEMFFLAISMSQVISADIIMTNRDRKEEIARKILKVFDIGIHGETKEESRAILENLDSVEISKLTGELEVIIRKQIQEKLDAIAAAAAAKPSRE